MAKPKRKPDKCKRDGECWPGCPDWNPNQRHPDTERLDALLRHTSVIILVTEGDDTEIFGENRMLTTRRDIDKLLREEVRRAK